MKPFLNAVWVLLLSFIVTVRDKSHCVVYSNYGLYVKRSFEHYMEGLLPFLIAIKPLQKMSLFIYLRILEMLHLIEVSYWNKYLEGHIGQQKAPKYPLKFPVNLEHFLPAPKILGAWERQVQAS